MRRVGPWIVLFFGFLLAIGSSSNIAHSALFGARSTPGASVLERTSSSARTELRKRGLVYTGLDRARSGPCVGVFVMKQPSGPPACTHGPDPAPAGIDVRKPVSFKVLHKRAFAGRYKRMGQHTL